MKKIILTLLAYFSFSLFTGGTMAQAAQSYASSSGTMLQAIINNTDLKLPTKPVLLVPTANRHLCDGNVTFSWRAATDASGIAHYTFNLEGKLADDNNLVSGTVNYTLSRTFSGPTDNDEYEVWFEDGVYFFQLKKELAAGRYSWFVQAQDNSGNNSVSTTGDQRAFDYLPNSTNCRANCARSPLIQVTVTAPKGTIDTLNPAIILTYPENGKAPSSIVSVTVDNNIVLKNIALTEGTNETATVSFDQEARQVIIQPTAPYLPEKTDRATYRLRLRLRDSDGCQRDKQISTLTFNSELNACTAQALVPKLQTPASELVVSEPAEPPLTFSWNVCARTSDISSQTFILNGARLFTFPAATANNNEYRLTMTNLGASACGPRTLHFELTLKNQFYTLNDQNAGLAYNDPLDLEDWNRWSVQIRGCNNLSLASPTWRFRYLPGNTGTYFFCTSQNQCAAGSLAECLASGRNCYFGDEASCHAGASEDCGANPPTKTYHWCSDQQTCTQGFLSDCAQSGKNCYLWESDPQGMGNGCLERANLECNPSTARYFWCDARNTCQLGTLSQCNDGQRYCYRQEPGQNFCPAIGRLNCAPQSNIGVVTGSRGDTLSVESIGILDIIFVRIFPFMSLLFLLPLGILFLLFPRPVGIVFDVTNRRPLTRALVVILREGHYIATSITNRFGLYHGFKLKRGQYRLIAATENYHFPSQTERPQFYTLKSYYLGELFNIRSEYSRVIVHEIPLDPQYNYAQAPEPEPTKFWWRWLRWSVLLINGLQILWSLTFILAIFLTIVYQVWFNIAILLLYVAGFMRRLFVSKRQPNVQGRVVYTDARAAADVPLNLTFSSGGQTALTTLTDQNGEFKFYLDPKRSYQLDTPVFNFAETTGELEHLTLEFKGKILELMLVVKPKQS